MDSAVLCRNKVFYTTEGSKVSKFKIGWGDKESDKNEGTYYILGSSLQL